MSEYKINYQAMIQQIKDHAMLELLLAVTPDDENKNQMKKLMEVYVRNGVSVETAVKIMKELGDIFKKEGDE